MLESTLEQSVGKYIKSLGGCTFKWVSPGATGVPDRICILPGGHVIFIELKRPGRKNGLSERQKKILRVLEGLGCKVWCINSLEDLKERIANEV
ncbi:MAG: VRR-NUC domain-containing protein [Clostridia bacterium]|nr:VRR-NUC domain-containing protein [Clostridia bacterium]